LRSPLGDLVDLVHELVDRQELHGRDTERLQVLNRFRIREAGVGPAQVLWDAWMPLREALDVNFVDNSLMQSAAQRPVALPVEGVIDDDRSGHVRRAVAIVALEIVAAERVGKDGGGPLDLSGDRLRVRIHEELGGIAAMSPGRIPRAIDAETVALAGPDPRQVAMPGERGALRQFDDRLVVLVMRAQV